MVLLFILIDLEAAIALFSVDIDISRSTTTNDLIVGGCTSIALNVFGAMLKKDLSTFMAS